MEVPTDFKGCFKPAPMFMLPATPIPSENCTGTLTYCFRRLYKIPQNGDNYTSIDECLKRRNINPDDLDGQPILNEQNYIDGVRALDLAYLEFSSYAGLFATLPEEARLSLLRGGKHIDTVREKLEAALSPELFEKISANIKDIIEKLDVPRFNQKAVVEDVKKLRDWIRNTTTEKYTVLLKFGWYTIPYN